MRYCIRKTKPEEEEDSSREGETQIKQMRGSSVSLSDELLSQKVVIGVSRAAMEQTL